MTATATTESEGGPGGLVPTKPGGFARSDLAMLDRLLKLPDYELPPGLLVEQPKQLTRIAMNVGENNEPHTGGWSPREQLAGHRCLITIQRMLIDRALRTAAVAKAAPPAMGPQVPTLSAMFVSAEQKVLVEICYDLGLEGVFADEVPPETSPSGLPPVPAQKRTGVGPGNGQPPESGGGGGNSSPIDDSGCYWE